MKYDVIIVGAGPAGLFSAYELINKNSKLKIAVIDKGFFVKNRVCPMNKKGIACQNCNPCGILSGYGGAGTFSDGKLNFIPKLGKSDLTKYMSESEAYQLIDETKLIFNKFKMDAEIYPSNMDEALEIKKKVAIAGSKLLLIKQKHLGSDHLPEYIEGICDFLEKHNVTLLERANVIDNKLFFPENIFYEDNAMSNSFLLTASHYEYIEKPWYYYYQHQESTVHSFSEKMCQDRMEAGRIMLGEARRLGFFNEFRQEIEFIFTQLFYVNTLFTYMPCVKPARMSFVKELTKEMKETFPEFENNSYYVDRVGGEEKKLIRLACKSTALFYVYYRLLWGYRGLRKRLKK